MKRLWPNSLLGQVLLAVALALLVAQSISAALLWRAGDFRRDQIALNAAAFRLVTGVRDNVLQNGGGLEEVVTRPVRRGQTRRNEERRQTRGPRRGGQPNQLPRTLRTEITAQQPALAGEARRQSLETDLKAILEREGVAAAEIVVVQRDAISDPFVRERPRLLRRIARSEEQDLELLTAGLRIEGQDNWVVARAFKPSRQAGALWTMLLQTVFIYLLLVGLHFLLLRRITGPLGKLTKRTQAFGKTHEIGEPLPVEGPDDVRRLIDAHNTMEARIAGLLDEKDVMLGAIGHDLKTPLAALRVRIESVDDEAERSKMADSIEDIDRSLDDILSLARIGRANEPPEKTDLSALLASIVEEFEDMGQPVTILASQRLTSYLHVTWLKRALRNLIDNALRYAGSAKVSLLDHGDAIILRVDDNGPGIADGALFDMLEPFKRGEGSRNRQTGGAGLGLTLARAIAEQHGGTLTLANRDEGGLRAEIHLPRP